MLILEGYLENNTLRESFNALAGKCFGIDFEPWYQKGFYSDKYIPHSIVLDGEVVANVSVSKMEMAVDGKIMRFLQLGTVMTRQEYRKKGYSRMLMEHILQKYADQCDGFFLFANKTVLDFYPKFGFQLAQQYLFTRDIWNTNAGCLEKVPMDAPQKWNQLINAYENNRFDSQIQVMNNHQLMMFYIPDMDVFFHRPTQTYIVADIKGKCAFIYDIFSPENITLEEVLTFFGEGVKKVTLAFTPADPESYRAELVSEESDTFFATGKLLELAQRKKINIPLLFHA